MNLEPCNRLISDNQAMTSINRGDGGRAVVAIARGKSVGLYKLTK